MILPIIQSNLQESLQKKGTQHLQKVLEKWFFFLNDAEIIEGTI